VIFNSGIISLVFIHLMLRDRFFFGVEAESSKLSHFLPGILLAGMPDEEMNVFYF